MIANIQAICVAVATYIGSVGTAVLEVGKKIIGL